MERRVILHFKHIVGWVITASAFAWCIYEWGFASERSTFLSSGLRRAASVAVFSVAAGLLVAHIMELPEAVRRRFAAVFFGTIAWLALGGCALSLWQVFRLRELLPEAGLLWGIATAQIGMCLLVGSLSVWLWRHYRKGYGQTNVE